MAPLRSVVFARATPCHSTCTSCWTAICFSSSFLQPWPTVPLSIALNRDLSVGTTPVPPARGYSTDLLLRRRLLLLLLLLFVTWIGWRDAWDKRINDVSVQAFFSKEWRRLDAIALERKLFTAETHCHSKFERFDDNLFRMGFLTDFWHEISILV